MDKIEIYNDQLHDMIVLGQISEKNAFDLLEQKITEGKRISFYTSSLDTTPVKEFSAIDDFKRWRKEKEEYSKKLIDLFTPRA